VQYAVSFWSFCKFGTDVLRCNYEGFFGFRLASLSQTFSKINHNKNEGEFVPRSREFHINLYQYYINSYQFISIYINWYQFVSIYINLCQFISIKKSIHISSYQFTSIIYINLYQFISNLYQFISNVHINLYQYIYWRNHFMQITMKFLLQLYP